MELGSIRVALLSLERRSKVQTLSPKLQHTLAKIKEYLMNETMTNERMLLDELLANNSEDWETAALALLLVKEIIRKYGEMDSLQVLVLLHDFIHEYFLLLLDHIEARVRSLMADSIQIIVSYLCQHDEPNKVNHSIDCIWDETITRIKRDFVRTENTMQATLVPSDPSVFNNSGSVQLDDTTGWNTLETSYKIIIELMNSIKCNSKYLPALISKWMYSDDQSSDYIELLLVGASSHRNRYIREHSFMLIQVLIEVLEKTPTNSYIAIMEHINTAIAAGMQDNWSQIRQVAVKSCCVFLCKDTLDDPIMRSYLKKLLPRLCLNRFYAAEGVKSVSHYSWREIFGQRGKEYYSEIVVLAAQYYSEASKSHNHVVCEAACHSMAELAAKILTSLSSEADVSECVNIIVEALFNCINDDSWPIRDASSLSMGIVARYFPTHTSQKLDAIWKRWLLNLKDSIWSVRENAAVAIGHVLCSANKDIVEYCFKNTNEYLNKNFLMALEVKREINFIPTMMYDSMVKSAKSESSDVNTKSTWRQGGGWGCCIDCMEPRKGGNTEASDGCVYLFRELLLSDNNKLSANKEVYLEYVKMMRQLLQNTNFKDCDKTHITIMEQLPPILGVLHAPGLADAFRPIVDDYIKSTNPLKSNAAHDCLQKLCQN